MQERCNYIANELELSLFCTNQLIWFKSNTNEYDHMMICEEYNH